MDRAVHTPTMDDDDWMSESTDEEFDEFDIGTEVEIHGIKSQPFLNGLRAIIKTNIPNKPERIGIEILSSGKAISVKKTNIMLPGPPVLVKKMSNSESQMDYKEGWHVNCKKSKAVSLGTPGRPDHTYSSVGFNIHCLPNGHVLQIEGFGVEGRLRRMRVYMLPGVDCNEYREEKRRWTLIYDKKHKPHWNGYARLEFDDPIIIAPEQTVAFYIHSDCDDDRGLKYRSCNEPVVHHDDYLAITRGFAHTSSVPFSPNHGWYRDNRVLSGQVYFQAIPIQWTNYTHNQFPMAFQMAVHMIRDTLDKLDWHQQIVDNIVNFLPFDHFGIDKGVDEFLQELEQNYPCVATGYWY